MDHAGDFSEAPKTLSHHSTLLRTGSVQQLCWGWHKVRESLCYFSYSALATASGKRWVISISSSEKVDVITKELQTYQLPHQDLPLPKSDPGPLDPDHQRKYECRHFSNAVWSGAAAGRWKSDLRGSQSILAGVLGNAGPPVIPRHTYPPLYSFRSASARGFTIARTTVKERTVSQMAHSWISAAGVLCSLPQGQGRWDFRESKLVSRKGTSQTASNVISPEMMSEMRSEWAALAPLGFTEESSLLGSTEPGLGRKGAREGQENWGLGVCSGNRQSG